MSVAKQTIPVSGTGNSSNITTWVAIASCEVPVSNGTFILDDIWLLAKGASYQCGSYKGMHRGKIVGGTISLVGSQTAIISFATGSGGALTTYGFASARITISGTTLILEVQPGTAIATEWYGGFTLILN